MASELAKEFVPPPFGPIPVKRSGTTAMKPFEAASSPTARSQSLIPWLFAVTTTTGACLSSRTGKTTNDRTVVVPAGMSIHCGCRRPPSAALNAVFADSSEGSPARMRTAELILPGSSGWPRCRPRCARAYRPLASAPTAVSATKTLRAFIIHLLWKEIACSTSLCWRTFKPHRTLLLSAGSPPTSTRLRSANDGTAVELTVPGLKDAGTAGEKR